MEECGIVLRSVKEYGRKNVTNNPNVTLMMKQVNGNNLIKGYRDEVYTSKE
jgi:hypothetical protein